VGYSRYTRTAVAVARSFYPNQRNRHFDQSCSRFCEQRSGEICFSIGLMQVLLLLRTAGEPERMAGMEDRLEKTTERRERIFNGGFTGGEWIGVLAASLVLIMRSSTRHVSLISDPAQWLGAFFADLLLVVVVWLIVRAIYRRITKKKPAGE
jgi:hypothetical protein